MSEESDNDKWARAVMQMGKTFVTMRAAYKEYLERADPVAADRAKRYIWSRIELTQEKDWMSDDWRAE